ncbi:MAG: hypothetical protein ACI9NQ_002021 [Paracoccaceae bacterium]|jgi:hypothetical protein
MLSTATEQFGNTYEHQVQNLSPLSKEKRPDHLQRASEPRICGAYHQELSGNLATANSQDELTRKLKAARLATLAAGTIAHTSCGTPEKETAEPPREGLFPSDGIILGYICFPDDELQPAQIVGI